MAYVRSWLLQSSSVTCCDLTSCGRLAGQRDRDGERNKNGCEKWWETGAVSHLRGAVCRTRRCCNVFVSTSWQITCLPRHTRHTMISCVISSLFRVCFIGHCYWMGGLGLVDTLSTTVSSSQGGAILASLFRSRHIPWSFEHKNHFQSFICRFIKHSIVRHIFTLWGKLSLWRPAVYWHWFSKKICEANLKQKRLGFNTWLYNAPYV